MKLLLSLFFIIGIFSTNSSACCSSGSLARSYFSSNSIFVAVLQENHRKNERNQRWTFQNLKTYKGTVLDTLAFAGMYPKRLNAGDTILVFGNNRPDNMVVSAQCSRIILLGATSSSHPTYQHRGPKRADILALELETIRFYQQLEAKSPHVKFSNIFLNPKATDYPEGFLQHGKESIRSITAKTRVCHIKVSMDTTEELPRIEFLNKTPRRIRKKITAFVHASIVASPGVGILSFLYPGGSVMLMDF